MTVTNRVTKNAKVISLPFTGISADGMLQDAQGRTDFYLDDIDWERIVIHGSVDVLTGTSVTFKVVTGNDKHGALQTTSLAAVGGDGSTAFASASITGTGLFGFQAAKRATDGSACSNIGQKIGIWADVTSVTVLTGSLVIQVDGK